MHAYHQSVLNKNSDKCAKCGLVESQHGPQAICDVCSAIGPCELVTSTNKRDILMCAICQQNEMRIDKMIEDHKAQASPAELRVRELTAQLVKELPVDQREFHVKEITAIVDVEQKLASDDNPQYRLAEVVEMRISTLRERLIAIRKEEALLKSAAIVDQKYLNMIVPKLRAEEREKFKQYDITYAPPTAKPTATATRVKMSATDRALESGAKLMGLTLEQYKAFLAKAVSEVTGNKCTCSETPGMCKVHPDMV